MPLCRSSLRGCLALTCALVGAVGVAACGQDKPHPPLTQWLARVEAREGVGRLRIEAGVVYRFPGDRLETFDTSTGLLKSGEFPSAASCQDPFVPACEGLVISSGYAFVKGVGLIERIALSGSGESWTSTDAPNLGSLEATPGGFVAAGGSAGALVFFDTASSTPAVVATTTTTGIGGVHDLREDGQTLWATNINEVVAIDVSNIAVPRLIERFPVAEDPGWLVHNSYFFQAHGIAVGSSGNLFVVSTHTASETLLECRLVHMRVGEAFSSVELLGRSDIFERCSAVESAGDLVFLAVNSGPSNSEAKPKVIIFRLTDGALVETGRIYLPRDGWVTDIVADAGILYVSQIDSLAAYDLATFVPPAG